MTVAPQDSDTYSDEETAVRREAELRSMLATPHEPHIGKKRPESQSK